jgi:hypothetical protein
MRKALRAGKIPPIALKLMRISWLLGNFFLLMAVLKGIFVVAAQARAFFSRQAALVIILLCNYVITSLL